MLGIVVVIGTKPYRCEGLIVGHRTAMDHDIIDLELRSAGADSGGSQLSKQRNDHATGEAAEEATEGAHFCAAGRSAEQPRRE